MSWDAVSITDFELFSSVFTIVVVLAVRVESELGQSRRRDTLRDLMRGC